MQQTHTRTVKLKLTVVGDANGDKDAAWKRLREIHRATWKAANEIVSSMFFNDVLMRKLYSRLGVDTTDIKQVQETEPRFKEFFGVKREATTEKDIKVMFPELPPCVTNQLKHNIVPVYNKEKKDMLAGLRSLRTYRDTLPIPVHKNYVLFEKQDDG